MGSSNGRAKPIDFRELLGCGGDIDNFSGGGAAARHYYDGTGVAPSANNCVFSVYVLVGHHNAGIVFPPARTR